MFADIPVDVGIIYEGERIRKEDMHAELGGPKAKHKFELLRVKPLEEVEDGKVRVIGPDFPDMAEGTTIPFGTYIEVAGKELEEEMEGVFERRVHYFSNFIEGFMHLNQRDIIWLRVGKKSVKMGLTLELIGKVLTRLYKSELPIIERIQITYITDPAEVERVHPEALKVYGARDARARGLKDEEVEVFYGCTLCQSFAPTHVCIITPQRYSNCGSISWFDGRAAAKIDPKGPIFEVRKGQMIDEFRGEWEGVNETAKEKTLGEISHVQLYTAFGYPHTSCGCFEACAFYMPEVDGLGIVHRDFKGPAINGIPFSTMADSTAGGRQVDGFHGISFEYMRSPKFLQVNGGWNRIVWVPADVKERVKDFIPKELVDKIPTERDVKNIDELKSWLEARGHPILERMKAVEVAPPVPIEVPPPAVLAAPPAVGIPLPAAAGGFSVILKDAKIYAERIIVRRGKEGMKGERTKAE